jgi:hypothetical protein
MDHQALLVLQVRKVLQVPQVVMGHQVHKVRKVLQVPLARQDPQEVVADLLVLVVEMFLLVHAMTPSISQQHNLLKAITSILQQLPFQEFWELWEQIMGVLDKM